MFEKVTKDILNKINDEDLINRSRSIKLGYNNMNLFKSDEKSVSTLIKQRKSNNTKISNHSGDNQSNYLDMKCCDIF